MTYGEKLKDPRWQRKRLEILQRDNFTCQLCGDTETTLHVHHKKYVFGNTIWDYSNDELVTYCEECHSVATKITKIFGYDMVLMKSAKYRASLFVLVFDNAINNRTIFCFLYNGEEYTQTNIFNTDEMHIMIDLLKFDKETTNG